MGSCEKGDICQIWQYQPIVPFFNYPGKDNSYLPGLRTGGSYVTLRAYLTADYYNSSRIISVPEIKEGFF